MRRAQLGPAKVDALILAVAAVDAPFKFECSVREEQEGGSAGKAVVTTRARDLAGYDYSAMPATGDKEVRARQFRSQAEAGNVAIVRGEWNEAFLSELESFPNGRYKDQVDATAHAFNDLITGPVEVRLLEVEWG
jgi:predicted phage terminase large subunit-like protein